MAISEVRRPSGTYIVYGYAVDGRNYRVYCGKKGLESTNEAVAMARQKHYDAKLGHARRRLLGE